MSTLSQPDPYGTRWSDDRTIEVRTNQRGDYVIQDRLRRTTHTQLSLAKARERVRTIQAARPTAQWTPWEQYAPGEWLIETLQGGGVEQPLVTVYVMPVAGGWYSIHISGSAMNTTRNWLVESHRGLPTVKRQALAWGNHCVFRQESP